MEQQGDRATLEAELDGWDPRLVGLIRCASDLSRWSLHDRQPLTRWVWDSVCLLGDACHPMLPYQSQGAAQALEDAVVLGRCVTGRVEGRPRRRAGQYQRLRIDRSARIQLASAGNGGVFHLPDGPEQQARDAEPSRAAPTSSPTTGPKPTRTSFDARPGAAWYDPRHRGPRDRTAS